MNKFNNSPVSKRYT